MNPRLVVGILAAVVTITTAVVAILGRPAAAAPTLDGVEIVVHKSATCGCCGGWMDEMRAAGATVIGNDTEDMGAVKAEHGIPPTHASCHTAEVEGYVVEGHVPVNALADLLTARPPVRGIALAGMPEGSPGMPGTQRAPFDVVSFGDGGVAPFGSY